MDEKTALIHVSLEVKKKAKQKADYLGVAKKVGEKARKLGMELSVHAPYYVNLGSEDSIKRKSSMKRILDSCERGHYLGAKKIVFHPGYYIKENKKKTFEIISSSISEMLEIIKKKEWHVELAPETMGKINVFGDLDEILRLYKETGCSYCIDYAHLYARGLGKIDFDEINSRLNGKIHAHFSGINFTNKGEQSHKLTDMHQVKKLFESIKKYVKKRTCPRWLWLSGRRVSKQQSHKRYRNPASRNF